jgi:hypothetical protein
MKNGDMDIIKCWIENGNCERMYYAQFGMFNIPPVEDKVLKRQHTVHSMALGIPSIYDNIYKSTPTPGQLFTNQWGMLRTGYCRRKGKAVRRGSSRPGQRTASTTRHR